MNDTINLSGFGYLAVTLQNSNISTNQEELKSLFDELEEQNPNGVKVEDYAQIIAQKYGQGMTDVIMSSIESIASNDNIEGYISKDDIEKQKENEFDVILNNSNVQEELINFLNNYVDSYYKAFLNTKENNGIIASTFDSVKNFFGVESGSNKIQEKLEGYIAQIEELKENPEKLREAYKNIIGNDLNSDEFNDLCNNTCDFSNSEIQKTTQDYIKAQKQAVDVVAGLSCAIAAAGALGAAPFTGGMSLGLFAGAVGAGFGAYMGVEAIDGLTEGDGYQQEEILEDVVKGAISSFASAGGITAGGSISGSMIARGASQKVAQFVGSEATGIIIGDTIAGGSYLYEVVSNENLDFSLGDFSRTMITSTLASAGASAIAFGVTSGVRPILINMAGDSAIGQASARVASSGLTGASIGLGAGAISGGADYLLACLIDGKEVTFDEWFEATLDNAKEGALIGFAGGVAFEAVAIAKGSPKPQGTYRTQNGETEEGLKYVDYFDKDGNLLARDFQANDLKKYYSEKSNNEAIANPSEVSASGNSARTIRFNFQPVESSQIQYKGIVYDANAFVIEAQEFNWAGNQQTLAKILAIDLTQAGSNSQNYVLINEQGNVVNPVIGAGQILIPGGAQIVALNSELILASEMQGEVVGANVGQISAITTKNIYYTDGSLAFQHEIDNNTGVTIASKGYVLDNQLLWEQEFDKNTGIKTKEKTYSFTTKNLTQEQTFDPETGKLEKSISYGDYITKEEKVYDPKTGTLLKINQTFKDGTSESIVYDSKTGTRISTTRFYNNGQIKETTVFDSKTGENPIENTKFYENGNIKSINYYEGSDLSQSVDYNDDGSYRIYDCKNEPNTMCEYSKNGALTQITTFDSLTGEPTIRILGKDGTSVEIGVNQYGRTVEKQYSSEETTKFLKENLQLSNPQIETVEEIIEEAFAKNNLVLNLSDKQYIINHCFDNPYYSIDEFIENYMYFKNLKTTNGQNLLTVGLNEESAQTALEKNIDFLMNINPASTKASYFQTVIELCQNGELPQTSLRILTAESDISLELKNDIDKLYDVIVNNQDKNNLPQEIKDANVPTFKTLDEVKTLQIGDVFEIEGENFIKIKTADGIQELSISKDVYNELFPLLDRFSSNQQGLANCYLIEALEYLYSDFDTRFSILSKFSQDSEGNICIKLNDNMPIVKFKLEDTFENYSDGAKGYQFLQKALAQGIVDDIKQQSPEAYEKMLKEFENIKTLNNLAENTSLEEYLVGSTGNPAGVMKLLGLQSEFYVTDADSGALEHVDMDTKEFTNTPKTRIQIIEEAIKNNGKIILAINNHAYGLKFENGRYCLYDPYNQGIPEEFSSLNALNRKYTIDGIHIGYLS